MMIGGPAAPLRPEEATVLKICGVLALCGTLQVVFAFTIPYITIGLLGLVVISGSYALAREIFLFRRTKYLYYGVFQPLPLILLVYADFVRLAEALDKDSVSLASTDDFERAVQKHMDDHVSAQIGICVDVLVRARCHARMRLS